MNPSTFSNTTLLGRQTADWWIVLVLYCFLTSCDFFLIFSWLPWDLPRFALQIDHMILILIIFIWIYMMRCVVHKKCEMSWASAEKQSVGHDTTQPFVHRVFYFSLQATWNTEGANNSSSVIQLYDIKCINILISVCSRQVPTKAFWFLAGRSAEPFVKCLLWGGSAAAQRFSQDKNICQKTSSRTESYQLLRQLSDLLWLTALTHADAHKRCKQADRKVVTFFGALNAKRHITAHTVYDPERHLSPDSQWLTAPTFTHPRSC